MAKYCPKCYAGLRNEATVCTKCGTVLETETVGEEDFTAGVFDNENLTHDVTGKEVPDEPVNDEVLAKEIVADEIIADGIVEEEAIILETIPVNPNPPQAVAQQPAQKPTYQKQPLAADAETPMSLGDWMITLLLLYLPIVNIVMLIIWSVDSKTSTTKKHFAWATLIFMGIGIVLSIIFSSILVAMIAAMVPAMYY